MVTALEAAVDNFETEYNHLPYSGAVYPDNDGPLWDTRGDIQGVITVLAAPPNAPANANFKKIKFFEYREPKGGPGTYKSGLLVTDTTAILYRPWFYADGTPSEYRRMRIDYDGDGEIEGWPLAAGESLKTNFHFYDWGPDNNWFAADDNISNMNGFASF